MSKKGLARHERKYAAKQQAASKFQQKYSMWLGCYGMDSKKEPEAVRKLVDKVCK